MSNPCTVACMPPDIMVCCKTAVKVEKNERRKNGRAVKKTNQPPGKRAKSRELRASILYCGCDCEKRNGLQDDCRRSGCHGSPECMTKPDPICGPSEFSNGKHLGRKHNGTSQDKRGNDENVDDETAFKTTVVYNCYPAIVKC